MHQACSASSAECDLHPCCEYYFAALPPPQVVPAARSPPAQRHRSPPFEASAAPSLHLLPCLCVWCCCWHWPLWPRCPGVLAAGLAGLWAPLQALWQPTATLLLLKEAARQPAGPQQGGTCCKPGPPPTAPAARLEPTRGALLGAPQGQLPPVQPRPQGRLPQRRPQRQPLAVPPQCQRDAVQHQPQRQPATARCRHASPFT